MDINSIFGTEALTAEQFAEKTKAMKLVDLNEGGYVSKDKFDKVDSQLKTAKETITQLEANKGNSEDLEKELQKYKDADEKRKKDEAEAERKAGLKARFAPLKGENNYLNEGTENWIFGEFEKAIGDKAYEGKSDAEIYTAITKDKNIYVNPNAPLNIPPAHNTPNTADGIEKAFLARNPNLKI